MSASTAYAQYKADNAKIASWLGRAALNHGYPRSELNTVQSTSNEHEEARKAQRDVKAARNARKKARARAMRAQERLEELRATGGSPDEARSDYPKGGDSKEDEVHAIKNDTALVSPKPARSDRATVGQGQSSDRENAGGDGEKGRSPTSCGGVADAGPTARMTPITVHLTAPAAKLPKAADKLPSRGAVAADSAKDTAHNRKPGAVDTQLQEHDDTVTPLTLSKPIEYILTCRQYTGIARYLVQKQVKVPSELFTLLDRCIELRKQSAAAYTSEYGVADPGHERFISILGEIRSLLKPLRTVVTTGGNDGRTPEKPDADRILFANRFADLDLSPDEPFDEIALPEPDCTASERSKDLFTLEASTEEAIQHGFYFFLGFNKQRKHIQRLWKDYMAGRTNLITAGFATNTALGIMKVTAYDDLVTQALPRFRKADQPGSYHTMRNMLESFARKYDSTVMKTVYEGEPTELVGGASVRRFFHLDFLDIIYGVFDSVRRREEGGEHKSVAIPIHPGATRDMNGPVLIEKLKTMMTDMLRFGLLHKERPPPKSDLDAGKRTRILRYGDHCEVIESLVQAWEAKRLNLFTVLGLRVLVDIMDIVDGEEQRVTNDAKRNVLKMVTSLDAFVTTYATRMAAPDYNQNNLTFIRNISQRFKDFLHLLYGLANANEVRNKPDKDQRVIFGRQPTLCGTTILFFRLQYLDIGRALMDNGMSLISIRALYNNLSAYATAAKEHNPLPTWPDLQCVSAINALPLDKPDDNEIDLDNHFRTFCYLADMPKKTITVFSRLCRDVPLGVSGNVVFHSGNPQLAKVGVSLFTEFLSKKHTTVPGHFVPIDELVMFIVRANKSPGGPYRHTKEDYPGTKARAQAVRPYQKYKPTILLPDLYGHIEQALENELDAVYFDYVALYLRIEPLLAEMESTLSALCVRNQLEWLYPEDPLATYHHRTIMALVDTIKVNPAYLAKHRLPLKHGRDSYRDWTDHMVDVFRKFLESGASDKGVKDLRDTQRCFKTTEEALKDHDPDWVKSKAFL